LRLVGRTVLLAAGGEGLALYRDATPTAQLHPVTVANDFFAPEELEIEIGDTVRWTNASGFHNVFSCTPSQVGCAVQRASEAFTSGPPTPPPWIFEHTFAAAGSNPYVCQSHAAFMTGVVTVEPQTLPPPGVPDGSLGAPMLASKLNPNGSNLTIQWDSTTCDGVSGHHIVWGVGSRLPEALGGTYGLSGAVCAIGASSPFTWLGSPPPLDVTKMIWWLVIADDGATLEGSWGRHSGGGERHSPYPSGASRYCGFTTKDLTNACGH
jgi:plastocyanin